MNGAIGLAVVLGTGALIYHGVFRHTTVFEYQRGILYRNGRFVRVLGPGRYRHLKQRTTILVVDTSRATVTIPGQEILTKDRIGVKVSLACVFEVTDPVKARQESQDYRTELYSHIQIALREAVAAMDLDALLGRQSELGVELQKAVSAQAEALGIRIHTLSLRDIMLPANLKKAFAGIMEAQKEAQRQLEKARGEQAVLRSLANAAGMYDNNPALLQARIIQTLSTGNHTVVFGADAQTGVAALKKS